MKVYAKIAVACFVVGIVGLAWVGAAFASNHWSQWFPPFSCPAGQQMDSSDAECFVQPTCAGAPGSVLSSDNETCQHASWWIGKVTYIQNLTGSEGCWGCQSVPYQYIEVRMDDGQMMIANAFTCHWFYLGQTFHLHQNFWDSQSLDRSPYWVVEGMPAACDLDRV